MIQGIGIDIIEVRRIELQLARDARFKSRVFTPTEIGYCEGKRLKGQFYAARFAAKEALLKALGTGLRGGMRWKDIEVVDDSLGKPQIRVSGKVRALVDERRVSDLHVSLSHVRDVAVAVVIAASPARRQGEV